MILHPFFMVHVDRLSPGNPLKVLATDLGDLFTFMVEMLKSPENFPSPPINDLLNLTWWLVNQDKVKVGMNPGKPMAGFVCDKECKEGMFHLPIDWGKQCQENQVFCAGGLVWASSLCRDWYNGRMPVTDKTVYPRASGYEAEFYLTLRRTQQYKTNKYQKHILHECPRGLASVRNLLYKRKEFMGAS